MDNAAVARADIKYGYAAGDFGRESEVSCEVEWTGLADIGLEGGGLKGKFCTVNIGDDDDEVLLKGGGGEALNAYWGEDAGIGAGLADVNGLENWAKGSGGRQGRQVGRGGVCRWRCGWWCGWCGGGESAGKGRDDNDCDEEGYMGRG